MKIGMLVNNLAVSGGYQKLVLRLAAELRGLGHGVTIYTLDADREMCHPDAWGGQRVVSLAHTQQPNPNTWRRLAGLVDPDLDAVVIHDEGSLHALSACKWAGRARPRTIWMLNNQLGLLSSGPTNTVRDLMSAARHVRLLPYRTLVAARELRERRELKRATCFVDVFAVYDQFNAGQVRDRLGRPATVVYAGADVDDYEHVDRVQRRTSAGAFNVLSVGVLFPYRRYEDLIEAVAMMQPAAQARLTIVGLHRFAPEYAASLRRLTEELGLGDRVSFREYVEPGDLHKLYCEADVFAFVNDGFTWGIAVFEAIAAGVPVLISSNVGAADLVRNGRHGWLVPPRDATAIAASLHDIWADRGRAADIASRARHEVLGVVRWSSYARRIEDLLLAA